MGNKTKFAPKNDTFSFDKVTCVIVFSLCSTSSDWLDKREFSSFEFYKRAVLDFLTTWCWQLGDIRWKRDRWHTRYMYCFKSKFCNTEKGHLIEIHYHHSAFILLGQANQLLQYRSSFGQVFGSRHSVNNIIGSWVLSLTPNILCKSSKSECREIDVHKIRVNNLKLNHTPLHLATANYLVLTRVTKCPEL